MIVESLALKNFLGYRRQLSLQLGDKSAIGIVGGNESGKSSILQAVSYGIYGRTRAERELQLINDNARSDLLVEICLRFADATTLDITRGRSKKNERILRVGQLKGDEAQEAIAEKVGVCYDDFIALSYFMQGDIHQFMTGNKRAYFQRWTSSLRYWDALAEEAKAWAGDVEAKRHLLQVKIDNARDTINSAKDLRRKVELAADAVAKYEEQVRIRTEQVATLQVQMKEEKGTSDLDEELARLQSDLGDYHDQERDLSHRITRRRQEAKEISTGKCPLLGCYCKPLEAKGVKAREETDKEVKQLVRRRRSMKEKVAAIRERVDALEERVERQGRPLRGIQTALAEARSQLRTVQEALNRALQYQATAKVRYEEVGKAKALLNRAKKEDAAWAIKLRRLNFLRFMCGKSGVPAQLIEEELERVEDKCNWVLDRLDYPKQIKFSAFKELAKYEAVCPSCGGEVWRGGLCKGCGNARPRARREEPTVTVIDGGVTRPFALESGGAQVLQSFAVRLAGSLFVASMMGVKVSLVMLDEVFAMLDASNRQKLMSLVIDKLKSEFGLKQQLIVSHQEDVISTVEHLLVVRRERGGSVATWA